MSRCDTDEIVDEWLERSGDLPLTIHISSSYNCRPGVWDDLEDLIDAINRHSHRWRDICIRCPSDFVSQFRGSYSGAPNLEVLVLESRDGYDEDFEFMMNGPEARPSYVKITGYPATWSHLNLGWDRVTHLNVGGINTSECIEILRNAPCLVWSVFRSVGDDEDIAGSLIPRRLVIHQSLQMLLFLADRTGSEDRELFLENFAFPHLTDLTIHYCFTDFIATSIWENSIGPFISRSCLQLTSLTLKGVPCQSSSLADILATAPLLQRLSLTSCLEIDYHGRLGFIGLLADMHASTISHLGESYQSAILLPDLEEFHYSGSWGMQPETDLNLWAKMLEILGPLTIVTNPYKHPWDHLGISFSYPSGGSSIEFNRYFHVSSLDDLQVLREEFPIDRLNANIRVQLSISCHFPFK